MTRIDTAAHRMVPSISPPRIAERECRLCHRMVSVHLFERVDESVCSVWCGRNDPRDEQRNATVDSEATPADAGTLPWHRDAERGDGIGGGA